VSEATERWTFGVEPLAQTEEAAGLLREVTSLVLALEQEVGEVDRLIADLRRTAAALEAKVPADLAPRIGDAATGDGRVYVDHARDIGAFNPGFPEYEVVVEGAHAQGTVTFPLAYEGPPGIVHGGFLALFFDSVVQHHHCDVGVAGKTTSLALRYKRPTPLLTPLTFTIERTVTEDRLHSFAQLRNGEKVVCEAEVEAIAGVRANLPVVSPRRSAP
jgi:hypothetical protein